jgi:hypothetical protein
VIGINLWSVFHGTQVFVPDMVERGRPGLIIYPELPTTGNEPRKVACVTVMQSATANILNDRQRVTGREGLSERVVESFICKFPILALHSLFR